MNTKVESIKYPKHEQQHTIVEAVDHLEIQRLFDHDPRSFATDQRLLRQESGSILSYVVNLSKH